MFDPKKLSEYLDRLVPTFGQALAHSSVPLSEKLDRYDLDKQQDYKNMGTAEFPIYGKPFAPSYLDLSNAYSYAYAYSAPQAVYWSGGVDVGTPPTPVVPKEDKHGKLKDQIERLGGSEAVRIRKPSPDYCHTLTAWRGWTINSGQLSALGANHDWEPKKAERARCSCEEHAAPQKDCQCGFWSFKTLDLLTEALKGYVENVRVIGTVEIWGKVIECENGFRSEYAYPKELWLLDSDLEHLSWEYGVPVRQMPAK